jgi:hypothetical protein
MEEGMVSDLFIKNIYAVQRNNYGHAIFIMKEIFPGKISKEGQELFIKHVVDTVKESLAISKKFNKTTAFAHIYLNECSLKNFSMSFFKKLSKILCNTFDDTLENLYIYTKSKTFTRIWSIARNFIDKETRQKIKQIKN